MPSMNAEQDDSYHQLAVDLIETWNAVREPYDKTVVELIRKFCERLVKLDEANTDDLK